jgi:hypothetical protein
MFIPAILRISPPSGRYWNTRRAGGLVSSLLASVLVYFPPSAIYCFRCFIKRYRLYFDGL